WQPNITGGPRGSFAFNGGVTAGEGGAAPQQYKSYAPVFVGFAGDKRKGPPKKSPPNARGGGNCLGCPRPPAGTPPSNTHLGPPIRVLSADVPQQSGRRALRSWYEQCDHRRARRQSPQRGGLFQQAAVRAAPRHRIPLGIQYCDPQRLRHQPRPEHNLGSDSA